MNQNSYYQDSDSDVSSSIYNTSDDDSQSIDSSIIIQDDESYSFPPNNMNAYIQDGEVYYINTIRQDPSLYYSYDSIYSCEAEFLDSEKHDGQYIIGLSTGNSELFPDMFGAGISTPTFYQYSYAMILHYLKNSSIVHIYNPSIDIIKIHINQQLCYIAIKKTFWLRIVQRTWKRIFLERCRMLQKRRHLSSLRYLELHGKYPIDCRVLPTLHSMIPM